MNRGASIAGLLLPVAFASLYTLNWQARKANSEDKIIEEHCQKQKADLSMCLMSNQNPSLCKDAQSELDYCVYQKKGY